VVRRGTSRRSTRLFAAAVALVLVAAACGGGDDDDGESRPGGTNTTSPVEEGEPVRGGSITYALEAETTGGWCLAEAQLAISGIQVARALYDTLTMPDEDGEIQPYLAESVTANDDNTEFTIKLREGIKFHDGSDLTAEVVKNNIDAYRGQYPGRSPQLFVLVFGPYIASTEVVDPLTVKVTTTQPWPAFPWYLWSSSRLGIMAQAQLDSDRCNTEMIGTGPFKLQSWTTGEQLVAVRNESYWQTAPDGEPLPYLDRITFVPVESGPDRVTGLKSGEFDAIHTSGALQIVDIREEVDAGRLRSVESDQFGEVGYAMLNATKAPFDNILARQAMAYAVDRDTYNELRNDGILTNAQGPFAPGNIGYLEDAGYPEYDPEMAQSLVQQYEDETGEDFAFTITHSGDPETTKTAELVQQMAEAVGARVSLKPIPDQSTLINTALGKDFQAILWRNHPGGHPDLQFVWWHCNTDPPEPCDNLVNFGGFNDEDINKLLEDGRLATDPAEQQRIYEDLNREFAEKLYNLWAQYTLWTVASKPNVHGVFGPDLPGGQGPFPGLGTGHPVLGMWVDG
jgi:peptide/nickel transport system substrate-binding protein